MHPKHCDQPHRAHHQSRNSRGFALIASISIMALLVMIALGMLTLSNSEAHQSIQIKQQAQAQANARMALSIAIGELQKYAGQDQRVTANADIHLDTTPDKSHILGVWSTENWDPTKPNEKEFLTWLATMPVTDKDKQDLKDVETPFAPNDPLVTVVGSGSLGKNSPKEEHVQVATLPIGNGQGSYGYWVSDEASKASYAVPVQESPEKWNKAAELGSPRRTGLEVLNPELFSNYPELVKSTAGNSPSYQSIDHLHPSSEKASQPFFHHLTNRSLSLLTDTRHGGIKADLSTAFELDIEQFNAIEEFHNSSERNATNNYDALNAQQYNQPEFYPSTHKLGYLFEAPTSRGIMRGPTWDLLRNHYRIYKRDWENLDWSRKFQTSDDAVAARGILPMSYSSAIGNAAGEFVAHSNLGSLSGNGNRKWGAQREVDEPLTEGAFNPSSGTTRATAARVSPLVTRFTMVVGVRKAEDGSSGDWRLAFSLDPYLTIVNPYNRAIEFESIGLYTSKYHPFKFDIKYTKPDDSKQHLEHMTFFGNYYNRGAMVFRLPAGQHRLEPGEVKVICPEPHGLGKKWTNLGMGNIASATFEYNDNSGIFLFPAKANKGAPKIKPKDGTPVEIIVTGRYGSSEEDAIFVTQHYSKGHTGEARDLLTHLPPKNFSVKLDVFDDPLICRFGYSTWHTDRDSHPLKVETSFNLDSVPDVGDAGFHIAALDIRMKHAMEETSVFHQFSPRGQIYDSLNYDGSDRMTPAWNVELKEISDVSELNLVGADLEAYWGSGSDASSGSPKVVLYDLPTTPTTSIASLSQADIASLPEGGSYHIGNSFPHPGLEDLTKISGQMPVDTTYAKEGGRHHSDFSWAANEAIWDRYCFSGINWGTSKLPYGQSGTQLYPTQDEAVTAIKDQESKKAFANPRIQYTPTQGADLELKEYDKIANHLSIVGGFNVNSTSVEAWRAVLSALKDQQVSYLNKNNTIKTTSSNVPFSRMTLPAGDQNDQWAGFRDLSDDEIEKLAEAMVVQVKTRGPFMGLADFVNRRLSTEKLPGPGAKHSEVGKLGALQMAIESAGINDALNHPSSTPNQFNSTMTVDGKPIALSTMTGTPGYLMQSDVLTSIGSILRTRSDTFVIRAYGDTKDSNGKILARAWCEATLQRSTDWFEVTDEPYQTQSADYPNINSKTIIKRWESNPNFPEINKKYGRKFNIVSFRWLSPDEV